MGIDVTMDMNTGRLRCNDCEKLRAEVERLKRERAAREADSLAALTEWAEKYRDARRAAMEEAAGIASGFVTVADPHTLQVLCGRIVSAIRAAAKEEA